MEFKRYKKLATKGAAILLAFSTLGTLTACQEQVSNEVETRFIEETVEREEINYVDIERVDSLSEIKPKFSPYKDNIQIDEESLLKIIDLAMRDVAIAYKNMGADNMRYNEKLEHNSGIENFYPEWMNPNHYLARAISESSRRVDLITDISTNPPENDAHGIMQICPVGVKSTLERYYADLFGCTVDLSKYQAVPTKEDLSQALYSQTAQQNIVKAVYDNIYLAISYETYNVKCLNYEKHNDYYQAFGGFDENIRRLAAIGFYGSGRQVVLDGLYAGDLEERLRKIDDMNTYLDNIEFFENFYSNYRMVNFKKMQAENQEQQMMN